eukprot:m.356900 g.356900  ORF g.356900 m.356900 type:complete len:50 (+) comp92913_c0_seq1:106-255(+)
MIAELAPLPFLPYLTSVVASSMWLSWLDEGAFNGDVLTTCRFQNYNGAA